MSLVLRTLLRDPLVTRPLTRAAAMRRPWEDDFWLDEWRPKRARRSSIVPSYESPAVAMMEDMSRQMNEAIERMHEFAEDLEHLDSMVNSRGRVGKRRGRRTDEAVLTRTEDGGLQLALDVGDFKPEDLKIKLVDDNLVIEASAESSGQDSYNKSHFKRWFKLPEDCNLEEIKSKLTKDNRLLIDLPSLKPEESKARTIPIEMERPATAEQQDNSGQQQASSGASAN